MEFFNFAGVYCQFDHANGYYVNTICSTPNSQFIFEPGVFLNNHSFIHCKWLHFNQSDHAYYQFTMFSISMQYATSCRAILEELPMVDMQLLKIDNNVAAVVSSYEDSAVRTASDIAELKKKSTMIEKNRALIKHLRDQAQSYVKNVNSALTRIKTAFIW